MSKPTSTLSRLLAPRLPLLRDLFLIGAITGSASCFMPRDELPRLVFGFASWTACGAALGHLVALAHVAWKIDRATKIEQANADFWAAEANRLHTRFQELLKQDKAEEAKEALDQFTAAVARFGRAVDAFSTKAEKATRKLW